MVLRSTDAELLRWVLIVAVVLGAFTLMFSHVEGWDLFDSFYFVLCTSTTSGFGDVVVSPENRLLASVFIIVAATLVLSLAANVGQWIMDSVGRRIAVRRFRGEVADTKLRLRGLGADTSDLEAELDRIMEAGSRAMGEMRADELDLGPELEGLRRRRRPSPRLRSLYHGPAHLSCMYRHADLGEAIVRSVRESSEGRDVAVAFSGGLDSGLVAGLAARYARSVHLYTCGTANAYDVVAADELSKRLGLPWTHVKLTTGNIGPLIVELMSATGVTDPFTVSYELQLFSVCRECSEDVVLTGQGADEYFMGCAKYVGRTTEAYDSLVRAGKDRLREVSIPCELAIASHFSKDLRYPYMDPEVIEQAEALDPEELLPRDMDSRKAVLKDIARDLGFDCLLDRRKKSSQYGSGTTDLIRAVARERGMRYNEYIDSLRGAATSGLPMSGRGSVVDARVDSVLKAEAERIIREGGMDPSAVIEAVYRRIVRDGDLRSVR